MNQYQNLKVWQKARMLVKDVYCLTAKLPKDEKFGLIDQMKRAAVSIPSNIAEGNSCEGLGEQIHFLSIARGSCAELETQIILSQDLGFISQEDSQRILDSITEILKMLYAFMKQKKSHQ